MLHFLNVYYCNVTVTSHFYLENDTNTGSIWTTEVQAVCLNLDKIIYVSC